MRIFMDMARAQDEEVKGKYKKKVEITEVHRQDENGNDVVDRNRDVDETLKVKAFHYKMELHGKKYELKLKKAGGHFLWSNLEWECDDEDGNRMFHVQGDGRNCNVNTTEACDDPVSMLLGAFAVSCKFDPDEVQGYAKNHCSGACSI